MSELMWREAIEMIAPHVVKITTPRGSGTGYLVAYAHHGSMCGIATAAHVVRHAHAWEEPIRVQHFQSGKTKLLHATKRAIFIDDDVDTAAIVFSKGDLPLPDSPFGLTPEGKVLKLGAEVGWVGFPALAPDNLCFFSGRVSSWMEESEAYLVDGVAINGVSGGPAFFCATGELTVVGVVSAYLPNRAAGDVLPGLLMVRHVGQFQDLVKNLRDMDQARDEQTPASSAESAPTTEPVEQ